MPPPPEILAAPTDASPVTDTGAFMEAPFYGAEVCMEAEPPPPPAPPDVSGIFSRLVGNWPTVEPERVITSDKFVSSSQKSPSFAETLAWVTAWIQQIEKNKRTSIECYDFARFQMARAGWQTTEDNWNKVKKAFVNPATFYQIYTQHSDFINKPVSESDRTAAAARVPPNATQTEAAINYITQALQRGEPVMAGIRLWGFGQSPNNEDPRNTTNHFVVIVGMGKDFNDRCFLSTFNSGFPDTPNVLTHDFFLQPNLMLHDEKSPGVINTATMSQIRESQRLSSEAQLPPKPSLPATPAPEPTP